MAINKVNYGNTTLIDLTDTTATADKILTGYGAYGKDGVWMDGSITSRDDTDLTVSGATVTVPSGYYAEAASKSVASGTAGTPTATKSTVSNHSVSVTPSVTNTTGYITGGTKTGTAVTVSASELVSGTLTIDSSGTKDVTNYASASVNAGTATNSGTASVGGATVTAGTNSITLSKSVPITPDVTAGYISSGTSGNVSVSLTGSVTTKGATTYTPTTTNQTIASGTYLTGTQTIAGDADLVASNIKKDVDIFGVTGTYDPEPSLIAKTVTPSAETQIITPTSITETLVGNSYATHPTPTVYSASSGDEIQLLGRATGYPSSVPATYRFEIKFNTWVRQSGEVVSGPSKTVTGTCTINSLSDTPLTSFNPDWRLLSSIEIRKTSGYNTFDVYGIINAPSGYYSVNVDTYKAYLIEETQYDGLSQVTVNGDSDLVANNIKKDIDIFGITGTYEPNLTTKTVTPTKAEQIITPSVVDESTIISSGGSPMQASSQITSGGSWYTDVTLASGQENRFTSFPVTIKLYISFKTDYTTGGGASYGVGASKIINTEVTLPNEDYEVDIPVSSTVIKKLTLKPYSSVNQKPRIYIYYPDSFSGSGFHMYIRNANASMPTYGWNTAPHDTAFRIYPVTVYDGLSQVTVNGDADLVASNIKSGVEIFGVTGTYQGGGGGGTYQSKTVTPTESQQVVSPDTGYDALSSVTVDAISSTYVGSGITRRSSTDLTASGATVTVPAGYYSAQATKSVTSGSVTAPSSISGTSASISTGTNTLTLTKTVSVTPNVTTAGYISSGTAGNSSVSLTASVTVNPTPTASGATVTVPAGYYTTQTTKSVSSGSATGPSSITQSSATVTTGTNTITLTKTGVSTTPTVSAGYVSSATSSTATVALTASVTTKAAATITPTTSNQTIASGTYLTGTQTIAGDADLVASNIISTANIFGVQGSVVINKYYTGSSAPSSSLGNNGDIYLQN